MLLISLPIRLRILFPKQQCWRTGGHRYHQRNRHRHHPALLRHIVTSSIPPSQHALIERPETIVLAESSLYNKIHNNSLSWKDAGSKFFPMCGLHFATIDLFRNGGGSITSISSLESLEQTLAQDLSHIGSNSTSFSNVDNDDDDDENINQLLVPPTSLHSSSSSSAHVVLIARGPIQCLIAQYYLESNPLAGLVLVDPILLPENGRESTTMTTRKKDGDSSSIDGRWETSLSKLMSVLMVKNMEVAAGNATTTNATIVDPPLLLPIPSEADNTSSSSSSSSSSKTTQELEINFLHTLLQFSSSSSLPLPSSTTKSSTQRPRPLKLEPNSVPILILYNGDHMYEEYYRGCAEWTAAFHAGSTRSTISNTTALPYHPSRVESGGGQGGGGGAMVWKIPKPSGGGSSSRKRDHTNHNNNHDDNDVNSLMMRIYEWYDEMVA